MNNEKPLKKDSARLVLDSKPRRAPNPKDIDFQTAKVVIPNPAHRDQLPLSFRDGMLEQDDIELRKQVARLATVTANEIQKPTRRDKISPV